MIRTALHVITWFALASYAVAVCIGIRQAVGRWIP